MAERKTLARPYAQALFQMAHDRKQLQHWSDMLSLLAMIAANKSVREMAMNPEVPREDVVSLVTDVAGKHIDQDAKNLVTLLLENRRLILMPEISSLYEEYKAEAESSVDAEVISAYKLTKAQADQISAALKAKLGREINLSSRVDESLVGGMIIRAGDMVIDGSVRGYLASLSSQING